ncbi:protein of unknown function, partial [Enterococcus malodoratus]|uniref:BppU family phage baseplate upper protein n=1 Tax=Enterococcus malodoratus TaxID=71451 RepID=UPI0008BC5E68
EDAVNGIVSIVLEDNILGYVGRVEGSIYIELPDSRSLDTAGRFTFDIKRSPIDEDVPELKDYYWQGFNEIMAQYHQTIATIKLEAKALLDSLTTDVTKVKNDIATANVKIAEIRKKLDDNDVFTKAESSANVVYQVIGKEKVRIPIEADLNKKVAGSILENGNIASYRTGATLYKPNEFSADSDINYSNLAALDNNIQRLSNSTIGNRSQMLIQYDLIDIVTRKLGSSFWTNQGADTLQKKVSILKKITSSNVDSRVWGFGDSPSGNSLKCANWVLSSSWQPQAQSMQNKITKITATNSMGAGITDDGKWNTIAYAEFSDGASSSSLSIDYAQLEFTIEISVNEFILSTIAANHVENLATQLEAETGTDNAKAMTPLRTTQQINKKAVTIVENQTIGGIKNFKDGLMINDDLVVSKNDHSVFILDSTTSSVIADGKLYFILHGSLVVVEGSIKFKTGVAYFAMISSSLPNSMIATISNGTLVGNAGNDSAKGIFVENGTKNIKASSVFVANEWFTCNGVYWAGKE